MSKYDYWEECIRTSFADNNIVATEEQIKCVAGDIQAANENIDLAFYRP